MIFAFFSLNIVGALIFSGVTQASLATVTTGDASAVLQTSASIEGQTTNAYVTQRGFQLGKTIGYELGTRQDESVAKSLPLMPTFDTGTLAYLADTPSPPTDVRAFAITSLGGLFVADAGNDKIYSYVTTGQYFASWGSTGSGDGQFQTPVDIVASDYLYVLDGQNSTVQKFDFDGTFISRWGTLGAGPGALYAPRSMAVASDGSVYITDQLNRVQKFSNTGVYITGWGSTGSASSQFNDIRGVEVDSGGNVYVIDNGNSRVQKFDSGGSFISEWAITADASQQITIQDGYAYVLDTTLDTVSKYTLSGQLVSTVKIPSPGVSNYSSLQFRSSGSDLKIAVLTPDSGPQRLHYYYEANSSIQYDLSGLDCDSTYHYRAYAVNNDGVSYGPDKTFKTAPCSDMVSTLGHSDVTDSSARLTGLWNLSQYASSQLKFQYGIGAPSDFSAGISDITSELNVYSSAEANIPIGPGAQSVGQANGMAVWPGNGDPVTTHRTYISDASDDTVKVFRYDGSYITTIGSAGLGMDQFTSPGSIAVDSQGYIYVTDNGTRRILKFNTSGTHIATWALNTDINGLVPQIFYDMAFDSQDNLFVTDTINHRILKYDNDGNFISTWGAAGTGASQFSFARSIAISDTDEVYVSDTTNQNIQIFSNTGSYVSTIAGVQYSPTLIRIKGDKLYVVIDSNPDQDVASGAIRIIPLRPLGASFFINGLEYFGSMQGYGLYTPGGMAFGQNSQLYIAHGSTMYSSSGITRYDLGYAQYSQNVEGLECETEYQYRAYGAFTTPVYGSTGQFTTAPCPNDMQITSESLMIGKVAVSYSDIISTNSTNPDISILSGEFPPGLQLGTDGAMYGTPTQAGTYTFTVSATDLSSENKGTTTKEFSITIDPQDLSLDGCSMQLAVGESVSVQIGAHNNIGPVVYQLGWGVLPQGLTFDASGVLSGTPSQIGQYQFGIQASDVLHTANATCTLIVYDPTVRGNTPMITIDTPPSSTTITQDQVTISGTGPKNSIIQIAMDDEPIASVQANGAGVWSYTAKNIFPGTHSYQAQWLPQGSIVTMPVASSLGSASQSYIALFDSGTNQEIKRLYDAAGDQSAVNLFGMGYAAAASTNKIYMVLPSVSGDGIDIKEFDISNGQVRKILESVPIDPSYPRQIALNSAGNTLYMPIDNVLLVVNVASRATTVIPLPESTRYNPGIAISTNDSTALITYSDRIDSETAYRKIMRVDLINLTSQIYNYGSEPDLALFEYGASSYARLQGQSLYAVYGDGVVAKFDLGSNTVTQTYDLGYIFGYDPDEGFTYENPISISLNTINNRLYVTSFANDGSRIRSIDLVSGSTSVLWYVDRAEFYFAAHDSITNQLYNNAWYGSGPNLRLDAYNVQAGQFADESLNDVVAATPTYGYNDTAVYRPAQAFTASVTIAYLPSLQDELPDSQNDSQTPPVNRSTPPGDNPRVLQPATVQNAERVPLSPVRNSGSQPLTENTLLGLVRRLPEPVVTGLPWLLLLLALILVGSQYVSLHSESVATRRMQLRVAQQERLVDEQNNFVALSTHYLHTPLTVMEGEISLMVKAGTISELEATKLRAALSSMNQEVESILAQEEGYKNQ